MNKIIKTFITLVLIVIFTTLSINADAAITKLPNQNQAPKMITMSLYGDASQMAFNYNTKWETDTVLQVVKDGEDFNSTNLKQYVGVTTKSPVLNDGFIHRVVATNLDPNTKYLYRLGDPELDNWSDVGSFKTANNSNSLRFVHLSDPQGYEELHYTNYNELLLRAVETSTPNFIALTGDIVNDSYKDAAVKLEQWEWALTEQKEVLQNIPVMATAGNHEASANDFNSRFNYNVAAGSDTVSGCYYSFNYNNVHFTVLNTNDTSNVMGNLRGLSDEQLAWLIEDLRNSQNASFRIVMMHKGIYDAGGHCSNVEGEDGDIKILREQLTPIFAEHKVDLVLQGHDHLYSRSYPINAIDTINSVTSYDSAAVKVRKEYNGNNYSLYQNPNGAIYLNSGTASGSKYYATIDYNKSLLPIEVADSSNDRMFTEIVIDGDSLYATVYKLSNKELNVYDTFGITKDSSIVVTQPVDDVVNETESKANYTWLIILGAVVLVVSTGATLFVIIRIKHSKKY